ncbi:hypothetical protein OZX67_02265 [Bifidobacterium sp. ESL0728]|uniref:hypothetical protein n=1 Tax=Bifidobacterium sp. ESL0728 TaxID=2983220 RepID=UPI0023F880D9|nr:hypothetical protein [Bifidobacterium sp. ESL0728]WEV59405.1 hypothetical protein OZX67_02265 [Bifidobacterium sp. ESL0728]
MSGVVVLVILAILILGWLPRRTADSMKKVVEHREDKYSPSLHLVDAGSGTRFSDERQPSAKGIVMQSERKDIVASPARASVARPTKAMKERARVAHIRRLRREAARRRAIISASLLVITIVVLAISFPLKFSPLFALIPAALLAVVVALGIRTANHARAWERDLKAKRAAQAKASTVHQDGAAVAGAQVVESNHQAASKTSAKPVSRDEQPTGLMAEQEIQKAMKQSRAEKEHIENRRAAKAHAGADRKIAESQPVKKSGNSTAATEQAVDTTKAETKSDSTTKRVVAQNKAQAKPSQPQSQSTSARRPNPQAADASKPVKKEISKQANPRRQNAAADNSGKANTAEKKQVVEPTDATNELKQVHPARALDLVDLAPNQDLISFSLGAPRNGIEVKNEEPKSLEIKSTRQVAKAKAKDQKDASASASKRTKESSSQSSEKGRNDSASSSLATSENEAEPAKGSAGRLISKRNRKRIRSEAKRGHAAAGRNSKAKDEKPAYTSDPEKFHAAEVSAETEAPAVSSDSLGTGLEKILERRNV